MNILVINPANKPFTNKSILAEPIDVLLIATILKTNFDEVSVIDMDAKRMKNNINSYLKEDNIIVFVYDYQIPLHTFDAINNIFETINNLNKNCKTIIIGKTPSYLYDKFINIVDIIISNIVENNICEVIENINDKNKLKDIPNLIFKTNDEIIKTNIIKLENKYNELPIPDRSLVDINDYMDTRTMITSRGCVGNCKFCSTPFFFGSWKSKSVEDVIREIKVLVEKYNAKKIMFLDDNATVDKNRMLSICKRIKEENINCLFGALSSIKCYDKELFLKMYEVGFRWIHFGIESGSERILELMNKKMNIDYIKNVIKEVKNIGFRIRTSFILDYPSSTKEDINKTRDLILELEPHEIRLHYLAYRVGTPIYDKNQNDSFQYIHNNKPNIINNELTTEIENLIKALREKNYEIINDEIDWNKYNNCDKDTKIVAFTPIKYGMCWYE